MKKQRLAINTNIQNHYHTKKFKRMHKSKTYKKNPRERKMYKKKKKKKSKAKKHTIMKNYCKSNCL